MKKAVCPICGEVKEDFDAEYVTENGFCQDCDK